MRIEFAGNKKVNAVYDGFEIRTDQPVESGGEASAPEPFDLFLASIGTCAGIYIVYFCEARQLSTEGIHLKQTWTRDENKRLASVELEIEVPADFPTKYHKALIRAADQCSIKRLLQNPPTIESRVVTAR
jgi:ribosomal protein S12 methylthiotransferase accessory factor